MKRKIEIDNKLFSYHIYPRFGMVYAEIYYTKIDDELEYEVLNKEFGSIWRKPLQKDYVKADRWCKDQINWLREANIDIT